MTWCMVAWWWWCGDVFHSLLFIKPSHTPAITLQYFFFLTCCCFQYSAARRVVSFLRYKVNTSGSTTLYEIALCAPPPPQKKRVKICSRWREQLKHFWQAWNYFQLPFCLWNFCDTETFKKLGYLRITKSKHFLQKIRLRSCQFTGKKEKNVIANYSTFCLFIQFCPSCLSLEHRNCCQVD